ncbi:MAG: dephospho-CoA kinase [Candidatus Zixiibacteriota bacterium]
MTVIGITGGIASGKTEVAKVFQRLGAKILSGDEIGKDVVERNPHLLKKLVKTFGNEILDSKKRLNRKNLARIAFSSKSLTKKLNQIVHPFLLKDLKEKIKSLKKRGYRKPVVIDAALIVEWDLQSKFDCLIFVDCSRQKRIKRLIQQKGYTRKEAEGRIKAQFPESKKRKQADFVIKNEGSLKELREKAKAFWENFFSK